MLRFENVTRTFVQGREAVFAVRELNLEVRKGDRLVVMGPSGSGKSTLLQLAAGLDDPTSGAVRFDDVELRRWDAGARATLRRDAMGFVFQFFNLLPTLSALENVRLPLDLAGVGGAAADERALELLDKVGLAHRRGHFPDELSGGEMQRVALARALVNRPRLVLADEPTGNLDAGTAAVILDLLAEEAAEDHALILVTHDPAARRIATRLGAMRDGVFSEQVAASA